MIVYIDRHGEPPRHYATGWHDRQKKLPANHHALFKIASLGKLYNAIYNVELIHQGQLSLNETLADHVARAVQSNISKIIMDIN